MKDKLERRFSTCELRSAREGIISGYAAPFNSFSQDLGGFRETIRPGAFKRCLDSGADVRCLFNHSINLVLGRTKSGTLKLNEDGVGLFFTCKTPDTQTARDVCTLISRGDITGVSFAFSVIRDAWNRGGTERELQDVDLYDVSPVTDPAYQATSVDARSIFWPEGLPPSVQAHRTRETIAGCYELKRCIFVPTSPLVDAEAETERARARVRLAALQM